MLNSVYQKIRANVSKYRIKPQDILQMRNVPESGTMLMWQFKQQRDVKK